MVDLASSRFGGEIVWCNDEFFAPVSNLISSAAPVWKQAEFTEHGKWMDGWETRRRRDEGHDSCILRLGLPGAVGTVTVETTFFTGNFPESFSLEACGVTTDRLDEAEWAEIIPRTALAGDTQATFEVDDPHRATHLRLNIFPDGGVARLRVDGEPIPEMGQVCPDGGVVDLAVATVGGRGAEASDAHFSSPANLVSPTEPEGMWDGWETARRRGPGHDWAVVELGLPGMVESLDVDTRHFKGNSPGWVAVDVARDGTDWEEVCQRVPVDADSVNYVALPRPVEADRVRLNIHPDGGVARVRVWGRPHRQAAMIVRMRYLNALFDQPARSFFSTACASRAWVEAMLTGRPYGGLDAVLSAASDAFGGLAEEDWREAFAAHPRIGERQGNQTPAGEGLSADEQAGTSTATADVMESIAVANRQYEDRFGYTYIVRAAGRAAAEMLALATERLGNDPDTELGVAAGQQQEITEMRLRRMLCQPERG